MNPFESYIVELLQGYISFDGASVEVRREFMPKSHLPCITLDIVSDQNIFYRRTYPGSKELLQFKHECDINIHSWCNTEEERESINQQILSCYYTSLNHHYRYCSNYEEGTCSSQNKPCTGINGYKNKCVNPDEYDYQCLSDKHGLVFGTINIESPIYSDELESNPVILHSIFQAHSDYIETVSRMGDKTQNYIVDGEAINVLAEYNPSGAIYYDF